MPAPIDGLLFDLDGTLVDSDPQHCMTWATLLEPHGVVVDAAMFRDHFSGRRNPEILRQLLPHLDADACVALGHEKEALFRRVATGFAPLPGLKPFIERARKRGLGLALVTNAPGANVRHMLGAIGLADVWDAIVLAEDVGVGKPDPLPYRVGLERLGIRAERGVAFEDSSSGVTSAAGAGIFTVGLTTTQDADLLTRHGAKLTARDYEDPALAPLDV